MLQKRNAFIIYRQLCVVKKCAWTSFLLYYYKKIKKKISLWHLGFVPVESAILSHLRSWKDEVKLNETGGGIIPSIGRPSKKGYSQILFSLYPCVKQSSDCIVGQSREVFYINCYGRGSSDGICSVNNITQLKRHWHWTIGESYYFSWHWSFESSY